MNDPLPPITRHAVKRARERFSIGRRKLARLAAAALLKGTPSSATKGGLRQYLDTKAALHPGCEPVVHEQRVFIFGREDTLVTIWPLPREYRTHVRPGQGRAYRS